MASNPGKQPSKGLVDLPFEMLIEIANNVEGYWAIVAVGEMHPRLTPAFVEALRLRIHNFHLAFTELEELSHFLAYGVREFGEMMENWMEARTELSLTAFPSPSENPMRRAFHRQLEWRYERRPAEIDLEYKTARQVLRRAVQLADYCLWVMGCDGIYDPATGKPFEQMCAYWRAADREVFKIGKRAWKVLEAMRIMFPDPEDPEDLHEPNLDVSVRLQQLFDHLQNLNQYLGASQYFEGRHQSTYRSHIGSAPMDLKIPPCGPDGIVGAEDSLRVWFVMEVTLHYLALYVRVPPEAWKDRIAASFEKKCLSCSQNRWDSDTDKGSEEPYGSSLDVEDELKHLANLLSVWC